MLTKADDPTHKQKAIYSLTAMGIDLLPVVAQLGIWGKKYMPVTKVSATTAAQLEKGGPELLKTMKSQPRKQHVESTSGR